ncbi:MAG: hypothetical protein Q9196_003857 [Gyalolechia fulgens]
MQMTREAFTAARLAVHRRNAPYAWNPFGQCARYNAGGRFPGAAKDHPQEGNNGQESDFIAQQKEKQSQAPWHREGSDTPPVARQRSAGAMTKGKLLTTPSRLLKLIVPLTTIDHNTDRKNVEPLALLVHPQQPLSYLERLIQSELPTVTTARGVEKVPAVHFRAEDSPQDEILPGKTKIGDEKSESEDAADDDDLEESKFEGKTEKTGKLNRKKKTTHVARADGKEPQQPLAVSATKPRMLPTTEKKNRLSAGLPPRRSATSSATPREAKNSPSRLKAPPIKSVSAFPPLMTARITSANAFGRPAPKSWS